ncbi:IgGFc-binding protein [Gorilla gorilla gorilla]|uniref:IgGFc-binding protein n=1 Tax=Gorilla gorilla gorilla TaxID=9595 RepID=UPI002445FAF5|nr:IgGFc-binding protein [Gorilla gorilla gorilla]XP_055225344.1 IgGFc-binding protein [Gorilla gorilla gorilla]XP_055225345.1 IgGFc-binding protein [Gorilla gorilla gorilla]XP_055225346.1 IgGFc-binding protein [Gorilla gorilla gorilla]
MGALWSWWILWAGATLLWGLTQEASVDLKNTGREEFLTAFLQNYQLAYSKAYPCLLISSLSESPASVSILSQADNTSKKVTVRPGESVMVNISAKAEMIGSKIFQHAVVIHSDYAISVQALNAKPDTAELTLLRPIQALGTEYFVLTPPGTSARNVKEFAVVAGAAGASVSVTLKGSLTFNGKFYPAGDVLRVTLQPYNVAQLQSSMDLSGSKVTASSPVAVLSGHSCAQKHTTCDHVVEQLLPTSAWGTHYVVPTLASQSRYDLAFVVASQATKLTYNHGGITGSRGLQAGDVVEFEVRPSWPLYLSANVGIQVLLFGTGAIRNKVTYDPYLVLIPDVAAYCPAYVVKSVPGCEGMALVVAQTKAISGLTIDGHAVGAKLTWEAVPGSEFSYAEVELGTADVIHTAEATTNFGLLTFGLAKAIGYATAADCGRTVLSPAEPSCEGVQCAAGQRCQVVGGKAGCVAESTAVCRAQGDPHYTTFDGRRYDMMGTCSYTMAELCSEDDTLPAFSVEAKNEHRGSRRVSYVGLVTVRAYSHSVSLTRGEVGFVLVDNQRSRLPVSLSEGRLRVYQSGPRAVVELVFGLVVTYDWDCQLALSLPARFQDQVCGLCGNYNGDPADDFLTPDGALAPDAVEFASSWKLDDGDYLCEDGCQNNCPACTPGQAQHYEGDRLCGMLTKLDGPFAVCHDTLDPRPFLEQCVYDLCVVGGERLSLCRGLSAYAQACLELGISVGDWRSPANCPLSCPTNSRYELCGPACPTSCNGAAAPSNCSGRPCVEGCVCLPGFVASGGACVPASSCGCTFQGLQLAPGQEVWADELCQRRCTCNGATHQVTCRDTQSCPAGERCSVQNGLLGCYPDRFGTCQGSGDPHYVSFDGRRFDFMGTCTYLLVGSCGQNAALPAFRVLVENEHRGSQTVSYTRAVRVEARGVKVAVRREYPGQVLVDDILQYLPFQAADGQVQVFRQGGDAVVRTDFGLTVTYDWNARVTAKVPSSYAEALCGLCGNFNGDPADDLALRGGGQAANALAFGNSWQEETRPGCGATEPGDCPKLDSLVAQQLQSKNECGILADPKGPFRECHSKLDPQGAVRDCVYDRCLLPGQSGPLCDALATYAAACQAAGATVHPWRSEELCPLSCPPHSHYEACSYGCPLSCGDLPVLGGCGSECHEGCVCDEGFVLSGESCLPLASCGCVHQGTYHPPGQTFYPGPGCDSLCHCQEGGLVSCESSSCGPHEACQPSGGSLGCVAVGSSTCQASGDPHYTTFDGHRFDFMGTCVYVLAQTCGTRPGLHRFAVLQENVAWGNGRVSVTRVITVQVANFTLRLEQRQWKVTVNGVDMKLPVVLANGQIRASQHGSDVVIETDFGLRVAYDLVYYVRVTVPGNYYQLMCGLCGNYNGDPKDDFQKPNGSQAGNANEFGNSWEEVVPDSPCRPPTPCPPGSEDKCPPELEKKYQKEEFCGLLSSPTGPLASCHKLVDPQGPLEDCVFDLCLGGGNLSILCSNIHAYVSACQAAGGLVEPWRNETFCPMECPQNSHYELCADTCSLGCSALSAPPQCQDGCAEGCQCDSGFLYNGQACVPIQQCGCYHNGVYYEPEQTVLIDNCQQQCTCHAGKGVVCQEHSCKPGQVCQPSRGILSCVTKDPCHGVTCRPQETCKEQGGQGVCLPNYEATCWLWGDPHYHSFDGRKFDFQGTCNYVLATTGCPGVSTQGLTPFTVTTKNENRGNPAVSYVRVVTVAALGTNISIHKDEIGKVRVNGVLTALPVSVADGRISVTQGASKALLVADFGLQVSYDWNWRVDVTLPSSYHGAVCGLCGNMDRNPNNDQVFPNGTLAPSIPIWGGSWRAPGWDPLCWDECRGSCPTCPEDRLEQYEGPGFCGPLAPGTGGPFTTCHAHVPPESFFKGCVLDVCMGGGDHDILCKALASYVAACQAAGVVIEDWRAQVGCEITCPENSHYEVCGPPCPASCPSPAPLTTPAVCEGPCVEGCQCDAGFVLSADRCVSLNNGCGCWANGTYHEAGSEFWADGTCSQRCRCGPGGGSLVCTPASCGLGEVCGLLPSGQHGCQPISTAECQAWGDPHYVTLDGHRFDFQGTCEYLLSAPCHGPPLGAENFTVTVANEHRGSQAVSYTRSVTLQIYNHSLTLSARWPRKLQVDGVFVALPFQLDSLLHAHLSGADVVVTTTSGLSLAFDGDSFVRLRVPAAYAGSLCGLCGNYNQDPADDLKAVGGKPAGWQVGGAQGCGECVSKPCPSPCTPEQQESFGGPDACGVISNTDGPLAPCHGLVPPAQYFQGCLLDACQVQGHPGGLCPAVAAYVAACQAAGAQLGEWRRPDFCPLQCPAHSHYELCGDSCPGSCPSLSAPEGCESACREGCVCDAGFVLSGDTCVPVGQCGCLHDDRYYPLGQTFYPGPGCDSLCHCREGGEVSCEPSSCGPHETCRPSGGSLGCVAVGSTTCQASGDPHYTTFDGHRFDFMGTCVYVLAQTCGTRPGLHRFAVLQENVAWGNGRVSVTRVITVQVANFTLRLEQRQWKVTVNGVDMKLPVVLANGQIRASQHGSDVVIETDFGLRVAYDLVYYVRVTVPGNYYQLMCGLCGNYNGDPKDDFQKPNGSQAGNANEFGNSWEEVVPDSPCLPPPTCLPGTDGCNHSSECPPELEKKYQKEEFCGLLSSPTGPLASCHKLVDPQGPLEDCIFDLCLGGGNLSILCSNIHAYVSACQAAGGLVEPWRNETFCPMECPQNSHYELCADTCSLGCSALSAPLQCPDGCAEGCQCDSGFLYNGQACVPIQQCGCYHNGAYYEPEQTVLIDNCRQQCTCHAGKVVVCQEHSCKPGQVCQPSGGILSCVNKDPCHGVTCRPQETCKEQGGQGVCLPNYEATCWLWGDPHYHSFDGRKFDFQGTCNYVLATTGCPGVSTQGLTPFTVTTKNENRGNPAVSYVRVITVAALGTNISIHKDEIGKVRVNGVLTALPVSVADGRISVTQGASKALLVADFGLQVSYDWNWRVDVTLPSSYHGAVCGLCGNMDRNPNNDQVFPNGTLAPSIPIWGGSWRAPGWDPLCWDECRGSCPTCPEDRLEQYEGPGFCGPLAPGTGGPFTTCHAHVPPESFFKGCVLDVCMGGGDHDILCKALASYVAACQAAGVVIEDWRAQVGCEITCPENSHYEVCGPPCPASCPSPAPLTTPAVCEGPCVEGCQCDAGFVLSADRCVSLNNGCGCWANGTYHEAGSEFWADGTCSQRCRCGPGGGSLVCTPASCGLGEVCGLLPSGQHGCQPISTAECQAWGDPHYVTLDGHRFDFQGTCEYLLSAPCHGPPLGAENFTVTVANEHRGSQAVSYTRSVTLQIYNHSLTLSARWPRKLQVDGVFVALPFQLDSLLHAHLSGADVVVTTTSGLSLAFDGDSFVRLRVPAAYAGSLCGLCGNYNQDPADDLKAVGGKPAGWQVGGAQGCGECVSKPCPSPCTPEQQESFGGPDACGVISNTDGPLAPCHGLVPPAQYFQGCLLDACQVQGHPGGLCPAVAAYVAACQAAGAQLGEWRRPDFCPLQCPAHSHYELCGDSCPGSCPSLSAPEGCESACREGCVCDAGFVLSGDTCVPVGQCGCLHDDRYYPLGQTFYPGPGCDSLCHCREGGEVSCEPSSCGPHETCRPSGGSLGCVAVGSTTCQASGDPHYTTFDGHRFDFMGTCVYVLAQTCGTRPGLHRFAVLQENVAWGNGRVSVTRVITVQVANFTLRLEQRQWKVTVNGVDMKLPVVLANGQIRASQHGSDVVIETDFGLRVAYDLVYYVRVTVPGNYYQLMCGLCGNYNGDPKDDFQKPNGSQAGNANEFGNSWEEVVPDSPCLPPPTCLPGTDGCNHSSECPPELEKKYQKEEFCGLLSSPTGPLASCHKLVDPQGPLEDCIFDLCLGGGNLSILCSNIHAYVSACQAAGGLVEPWRNETFCPMECPQNSHYELCADTCSLGCSALSAPLQCPDGCAEGCQCDSGFLYNGQACVPIQQCGCYHNGAYYEPEQTVLIDNCRQQCTCHAGKVVVCQEHSCKPGQVCQPSGGILSCVNKDPCHGVTCRPQETCKEQGGQGVCLPNYEATCWLWGDPHYHSFDGRKFDFQGTCNYVLATTGCPGVSTQGLTPFTVTTKNENRGNPAVSYVRVVTVAALGTNISIHKDEIGKVRVNGVLTALPVSVADGRISVTQGASKALLVADFGLQVSYDWNWRVDVTLPSSYHGAVCGLCGNMDRNPNNDQVFPNGTLAPSIPIWGGSWRAPGWDPLCWDECRGSCPTCPEDRLEQYEGPGFCGPLAPGTGGPFTTCHAHVPPESFFKGCVLDVCMGGGDHDILCKALASYVAACQAAGVVIEDWRAQVGCEITCPENSHYEVCGPPCPASCPSPAPLTTPAVCEGPCVEGCQCDAGFVLSADRCVSLNNGCGCWANGTYHEAGSEFWADGTCSQRCRCGPGGGSLVCTPASCGLGEVCGLLPSGQHGCQPISTAECQAWGDPHYVTLDGHRFDFQGTCEYLLSAPCHGPPLGAENFTVTVANEHRGSQAVSYTRSVTLQIYNHSLTLSARWPRKLQVDGVFVALPFQLDSLLHAHLSGADVVVTTTSGLSLAFDGDSFVRLRVPAAYAGSLCGLCGNYNQDPADDLKAVGGKPAGWQVGGAQGCGECVSKPCPSPCTPEQQESFGGQDACGVISATDGPLAPCHGLVPPAQYFQGCLLDACQVQGHPGGLCPAVATYVAACQAAGAQLGEWRRPDFCPLQCPAHSHYELCGDSCPVSCPSLSAPEGCESACREGCVCDAGFVLSGDTCVPVGQCGCLHDGRYYPLGEVFYPGPECERRCECGPGGHVTCQEGAACGPHEECRLEDGVQACHATGCGRCLANGGIHYITLDGRVYDLHGSCSYVLAQVCHPKPGDEDFSIVLEKNAAGDLQRLLVTVAGQVVSLAQGQQVTVDGEAVALPVAVGHVRVTAEGRNMVLQTTKGLRLLFDGDAHLLMSIPSPFRGRLCGLCGNFNGNWSDDFVLPNGSAASSVETFGAAWRAPGSSKGCGEGCGPQGCPVCLAEETAPYESNEACGQLRNPQGPFATCQAVLSPSEYFRQCIYDLCAQKGDKAFLCRSLAAYTAACQAAGVAVKPWRTDSFCPLQCPAHSHYSICTRTCQGSCAALSGLTGCTTRCFEGCECDDRFLLSQGVCIPVQDCGCTHDGRYLPVNSSLLTSDCSERCSCSSSSGLTCQAAGCPPGRVCEVKAEARNCWATRGLCVLSVGANLTTFDGARGATTSPGVYELSSRCPGLQNTIPWYRVVAEVQICHGKTEAVGQVHIFFQDGMVTLTPNKGVWVNGLQVDLPAEKLASVSVSRTPDGSLLVHQKAGVQVWLGANGKVAVIVSDDHAGKLCGACGNFDGDQTNDWHDSQEKPAMEKWRAQDFSPCYG